jgi:hypothetical protein
MLDQILGGSKDSIIQGLTSKLGIGPGQANGFLNKALSLLQGGLSSGKVDPGELERGDTSGIMSKLDVNQLSGYVGGDTGKARSGMETIIGHISSAVSSGGGAKALLSQFGAGAGAGGSGGGVMGQVGSMAGKFFGKK